MKYAWIFQKQKKLYLLEILFGIDLQYFNSDKRVLWDDRFALTTKIFQRNLPLSAVENCQGFLEKSFWSLKFANPELKNWKMPKIYFIKKWILNMYQGGFQFRNIPQHLKFSFLILRTRPMKNSSNVNPLKNRMFWLFSIFDLKVLPMF